MTAREFDVKRRLVGATRMSVVLRDDNGDPVFCSNRILNHILDNPDLQVRIKEIPEHTSSRTGKMFPTTKWLEAYIPTRL